MAFNYAKMQTTALSLLTKFGRELTFTRTADGSYNPATGKTSQTTSSFSKYCAVFDYNDRERGGESIQAGDRRIVAEQYAYQIGDKVSIDSESYRIVSIETTKPSATAVLNNLQIRK
tara:strand:+ start:369 stop:719 length:351 start_codon:yes stop_codon:yes gene_type:complete